MWVKSKVSDRETDEIIIREYIILPHYYCQLFFVNIIVIVVYFYPRLRIRYPEFIIMVSEARYKTLHSTSHRNLSERVSEVDTALSYEPEGRGFESRLFCFFSSHHFSCYFLDIAQMFKATSRHKV